MAEQTQVKVTEAWLRLIKFAQKNPYCVLTVRVVQGSPTQLVDWKPALRFDKSDGFEEEA